MNPLPPSEAEARETFTSADGSCRCVACHLHPDTCTCGSGTPYADLMARVRETLELQL